jgi:hypothetical protein
VSEVNCGPSIKQLFMIYFCYSIKLFWSYFLW